MIISYNNCAFFGLVPKLLLLLSAKSQAINARGKHSLSFKSKSEHTDAEEFALVTDKVPVEHCIDSAEFHYKRIHYTF